MSNRSPPFSDSVSFTAGDFVDVGFHLIQRGVMALVWQRDGELTPLGTCFAITGDGLCLTARHVIEEAFSSQSPATDVQSLQWNEGALYALYIAPAPPGHPTELEGGPLPVDFVYLNPGVDVAMIKLRLPKHTVTGEWLPIGVLRLRMALPKPGDLAFAFGYHAMRSEKLDSDGPAYSQCQTLSASKGTVEEVHFGGRDRAFLPFPCFRVSSRYDGGMSGGPVMNEAGQVIGVVCSSLGDPDDGGGHISYASLIGPVLGMALDATAAEDVKASRHFLWDLVTGGAVVADSTGVMVERRGEWLLLDFGEGASLQAKLD